jgi:hypothetical protein
MRTRRKLTLMGLGAVLAVGLAPVAWSAFGIGKNLIGVLGK